MAQTVRIANPLPGGAAYTSIRNAQDQQRRGYARIVEGVLYFDRDIQAYRASEMSAADRHKASQELPVEQRGTIWWNGCKGPRATFPPFCNVSIPRPDAQRSMRNYHQQRAV